MNQFHSQGNNHANRFRLVILCGLTLVFGLHYGQPAGAHDPSSLTRALKIRGTAGHERIVTHNGNDVIHAGSGDDIVLAGGGDDVIHAGPGNDRIHGGVGQDRLYGDSGDDFLDGGLGNDLLKGEQGNDFLNGGSGDDELHSRWGNDYLVGGAGKDSFIIRPSGSPEFNQIRDFTPGVDNIDLSHPGIHVVDFMELLSLARQTSKGVEIRLPTNHLVNDRLLLMGITIGDLQSDDFTKLPLNASL